MQREFPAPMEAPETGASDKLDLMADADVYEAARGDLAAADAYYDDADRYYAQAKELASADPPRSRAAIAALELAQEAETNGATVELAALRALHGRRPR